MTFKELLENKPNGFYKNVENVIVNSYQRYSNDEKKYIAYPELELFSNDCNGNRSFVKEMYPYTYGDPEIEIHYPYAYIFEYLCSNCKTEFKYFALKIDQIGDTENADINKFGEYPPRVKNLPTKLITIFGSEKELLIKGKNCENQGFGIGAMTYYRRIVENQKNRLLDSIIKTIKKLGNYEQKIQVIEKAKTETQFIKSIDLVKDLLPDELFIDGHNPMILLHSAMSKGVHNLTDEECLEIASKIRIVLTEMTIRISEILSDERNLKTALNTLNNLK